MYYNYLQVTTPKYFVSEKYSLYDILLIIVYKLQPRCNYLFSTQSFMKLIDLKY